MNNLVRLTEKHATEAGIMLARAFHDYPQFDHTHPNLEVRTQKLPEIKEFN